VSALHLAHDRNKPWLIAPAMNPAMWSHPATAAAVGKLRAWGVRFLPADKGRTACGETGEGRLAEPEMIVAAIENALHRPARPLRVLVTSGGTAEPIDGVRVLTNTSTGSTGAGIATQLNLCGHEAVLLRAHQAKRPETPCREETFETFADLEASLTRLLGTERFDAVIHAAAVGDFGVESVLVEGKAHPVGGAKLDSRFPPLLQLKENPKLLDSVRALSPTPLKLIAFKLTRGTSIPETHEAVRSLFARGGSDWVVHNDLANRLDEAGNFPADIYQPNGSVVRHCNDRTELAVELERLLANSVLPH
jgi:phosphopantothenoylcysteine decarboxylase/phosphopantothenate--cysteine ligase